MRPVNCEKGNDWSHPLAEPPKGIEEEAVAAEQGRFDAAGLS